MKNMKKLLLSLATLLLSASVFAQTKVKLGTKPFTIQGTKLVESEVVNDDKTGTDIHAYFYKFEADSIVVTQVIGATITNPTIIIVRKLDKAFIMNNLSMVMNVQSEKAANASFEVLTITNIEVEDKVRNTMYMAVDEDLSGFDMYEPKIEIIGDDEADRKILEDFIEKIETWQRN
jgi:hypothetical protein